jgi:hydroxyacylglutathione hydrolase
MHLPPRPASGLHACAPGWHLLGSFPPDEDDGVGSWLLTHNDEALLLEIPIDLTVDDVRAGLDELEVTLRYVTVSHSHYDHWNEEMWAELKAAFPDAEFVEPWEMANDRCLDLGGEPLWLVKAPKHSFDDMVTVFRGIAMTGDIETMQLHSGSGEVNKRTRRKSMKWLRHFQERSGYHVHTTVSAHLNSVRTNVDWADLFTPRDD